MNNVNGEVRSVCIVYCIQTAFPRRCSEMNNGEVRSRLYFLLYTEQVTSPLFGNEQRQRRDEVRSYYLLQTDRVTSPLFGKELTATFWFICIVYYKETDLPRRCSERHKARFGPSVSIYSPLPLFGNEQRRNLGVCIYKLSFNLTYFSFNTLVSSHIFFLSIVKYSHIVCVFMYVCTPS